MHAIWHPFSNLTSSQSYCLVSGCWATVLMTGPNTDLQLLWLIIPQQEKEEIHITSSSLFKSMPCPLSFYCLMQIDTRVELELHRKRNQLIHSKITEEVQGSLDLQYMYSLPNMDLVTVSNQWNKFWTRLIQNLTEEFWELQIPPKRGRASLIPCYERWELLNQRCQAESCLAAMQRWMLPVIKDLSLREDRSWKLLSQVRLRGWTIFRVICG